MKRRIPVGPESVVFFALGDVQLIYHVPVEVHLVHSGKIDDRLQLCSRPVFMSYVAASSLAPR